VDRFHLEAATATTPCQLLRTLVLADPTALLMLLLMSLVILAQELERASPYSSCAVKASLPPELDNGIPYYYYLFHAHQKRSKAKALQMTAELIHSKLFFAVFF